MRASGSTQAGFNSPHERRAWVCGRTCATAVCDEHGTSNPEVLATVSGIDVIEDDWNGLDSLVLLGTYRDGTITLYREQVRDVATANDVPVCQLIEATLAHELGHCLVDLSEIDSSRTKRWRDVAASFFGIDSRPKVIHEAAANGFCFALLESRFETSPLFDCPEILSSPSE